MHKSMFMVYFFVVCSVIYGGYAQEENVTTTSVTATSTMTVTSTSVTPAPNISCEAHNNDCKGCVENSKCYYCEANHQCHSHVQKAIVDGQCDISHAYFLTCRTSLKVMLILIGVLGGIPLLIIVILCCYCCCKRKGIRISKDDLKWARQREERRQIADERRKERAERTEEIRKKYGLVKDSNPYQRFDA